MSESAGYAEADLAAALERLIEGQGLREAESEVAAAAPALQRILIQALASGGWFEESHQGELARAAAIEDPAERTQAVATLLAEETRVSMMVGVAVGWALAGELGAPRSRGSS